MAYEPRIWVDGDTVDETDLNRVEGAIETLDTDVTTLTDTVAGIAGANTDASALTTGLLGLERLPPGSVVIVDYYRDVYGEANAWPASRPTARTDIVVVWQGPTDPGTIAIAADSVDLTDAA